MGFPALASCKAKQRCNCRIVLEILLHAQECARYLETLKSYESKPADLIQGRAEEDYMSKLNAALTTVRGVNRTDVLTLAGAFRTAAGVMRANMQELSALPGIGPTKVGTSPGPTVLRLLPQIAFFTSTLAAKWNMRAAQNKAEC